MDKCFVSYCDSEGVNEIPHGKACRVHVLIWEEFTPEGEPATLGVDVGEKVKVTDVLVGEPLKKEDAGDKKIYDGKHN